MRKFLSSTAGATFNQVLSSLVRGSYKAGINVHKDLPITCWIDKTVCDAALLLVNKSLKMYNKLFKNPPFPAWKTDLDEVWN